MRGHKDSLISPRIGWPPQKPLPVTATLPHARVTEADRARWLPWLWLLLYFGAHVVSRLLISDALELDEAEQALWTQRLEAGYGAQPPLYTWLQWAVFQLLGVSVFSLALLKNLLLALTYIFVFLAARVVVAAPLAVLASACMLLLPQIGWESQRDLTHSVLVTTLAAATLYAMVLMLRRPRPVLYLAIGVVAGLGVLAKYSYVAFIVALGIALSMGRDTRGLLRSRWILASGLVALLIVLPHALWLLDHWQQAAHGTLDKLGTHAAAASGVARAARGFGSLAAAVVAFLAPWGVVMLVVFGRSLWRPSPQGWTEHRGAMLADTRALWLRYALVLALIFGGMVLFGDVSRFKDRWMQPFLFLVPLAFLASAPQLARHPRLAWLPRILAGVAVLILVLLALRVPVNAWRGRPDELNLPARELAMALQRSGYDGRAAILTSDRVLGGVLRLQFPEARVHVAKAGAAPPSARPLLAIESVGGERAAGTALDAVEPLATGRPAVDLALTYRHAGDRSQPARFRARLVD